MTANSSKSLPFIVLAIITIAFLVEGATGVALDLEMYVPVLTAIGVGGAAKAAIERAGSARKALDPNTRKIIEDQVAAILKK